MSSAVDVDDLKAVHRRFPTGVTIVTAIVDGEPRGLVVNAFASISLTPPLILVSIAQTAATHEFLYRGRRFGINMLASDQIDLMRRFASPIPDKFDGVDWRHGAFGTPLLDGACAALEAEVQERARASTHTVFVGIVLAAHAEDRAPLVYMGAQFYDGGQLGPPLDR